MRKIPPTALAPTAYLATPKVRKFAEKIVEYLEGKPLKFFMCEPCTHDVVSYHVMAEWVEGSWSLDVEASCFSDWFVEDINLLSKTVRIESVKVTPLSETRIKLRFCLSARVMRH